MPPATQHEAYVFDAYGTLFDVHAAVRRHASDIGPDGPLLSEIWRNKQLEYSWVRSLMGAYVDFWKLTEQALDFALERVPSVTPSHRDTLLEAYWKLDCYEEVPTVLKALKDQGAKLAILSNGSREMLESAVRNAALDTVLDDIFSVEDVRTFKPAPGVYEMATTAYRLYPQRHFISIVQSMGHCRRQQIRFQDGVDQSRIQSGRISGFSTGCCSSQSAAIVIGHPDPRQHHIRALTSSPISIC